jgi:hypothetical protein
MKTLTENIINGNASLAKFMGFKMKPLRGKNKDYEYDYWYFDPNSPALVKKDVFFGVLKDKGNYEDIFLHQEVSFGKYQFHKDWNLLMPVVEKIENIRDRNDCLTIVRHSAIFNGGLRINSSRETKKEAVWNACVAFVELYNKDKNL